MSDGHAGNAAAACAGAAVRSSARSFADRARGLAEISSSPGVTTSCQNAEAWRGLCDFRQMPRSAAGFGPLHHEILTMRSSSE